MKMPLFSSLCLSLFLAFCLSACSGGDNKGPVNISKPKIKKAVVDSFIFVNPTPIQNKFVEKCPLSSRFDFPVGVPDKKGNIDTSGYFKARGFLGMEHLGDDWNRKTGGNSDIGNFVYCVADGVVFESIDYGGGWGLVVRVLHNTGTKENPAFVESVYAHLSSSFVQPGNTMKKGDVLATIGNAKGKYHAHLHFEIREKPGKAINAGYDGDTLGFQNGTDYIGARRQLK